MVTCPSNKCNFIDVHVDPKFLPLFFSSCINTVTATVSQVDEEECVELCTVNKEQSSSSVFQVCVCHWH